MELLEYKITQQNALRGEIEVSIWRDEISDGYEVRSIVRNDDDEDVYLIYEEAFSDLDSAMNDYKTRCYLAERLVGNA